MLNSCLSEELLKLPWVGLSIVPRRLRKVVFPPPDGPLIITNSPFLIAPYFSTPFKVIFLRATTFSSPTSL